MVRRAINPGYGLWVVPGGFVDMGEVVEEAVVRETQEETYLTVRPIHLLNIYSYPDHRTIIAAYVTEYVSGELGAGDETLEARVFGLKEIPWPADRLFFHQRGAAGIYQPVWAVSRKQWVGCVLRTIFY